MGSFAAALQSHHSLQLDENSVRLYACIHVNIILFLHNVDYLFFSIKSVQGFR